MKKITFLLVTLIAINFAFSQIIHNDIADFTFTHSSGVSLDFDFNNDGVSELNFAEDDFIGPSSLVSYPNMAVVDIMGTGTLASGHGWDIARALPVGFTIDATGVFDIQGDVYVNAPHADPNEIFPEGISFIGVKLIYSGNTHYGWIRVNSVSNVITVLDYAYNTVAGASINTGQTLEVKDYNNALDVSCYPNPTKDIIHINTIKTIEEAHLIDALGRTVSLSISNNEVNISTFPSGAYFLHIKSDNKTAIIKIIKL